MADHNKLPSGKTYYANCDIIGIGPDHTLSEGYDGNLAHNGDNWDNWRDWDPKDLEYIADMMISRWTYFKENMSKIIKDDPDA